MAITTGDVWTFKIKGSQTFTNWVKKRLIKFHESYDPAYSWQFVDGEYKWTDLADTKGGGRYRNNLIIISVDSDGKGKILYT